MSLESRSNTSPRLLSTWRMWLAKILFIRHLSPHRGLLFKRTEEEILPKGTGMRTTRQDHV
ncbi:hypothetical protein PanWU01x14_204940 [Parasponia andersonii]|uniref:Uncharacterized protein n=1 Tax=Parasponia andersonii TaxID=3476 RepID=A0A2P5BWE4_PARAD|nr:hypothetical protein PanWU01x14_204940 [Parasponia andersonii]